MCSYCTFSSLFACSSEIITIFVEGTWYLKSEIWYQWKDGKPDMNNVTFSKTYDDFANERIWIFKKSGENLLLTDQDEKEIDTITLKKEGNNEYAKGGDLMVIKSISANKLIVEYYDHYYSDNEYIKEYGFYTFMR